MKRYKFFGLLAAAVIAAASWSCDDDKELVPLAKSDISSSDVSYNSLKFSWGKVKDARQYSYQLVKTATEAIIETGITKETSVSFSGLDYDTEYTLTVLAYAAIESDNTTSEPIVLTARTNDLITLPSPVLSWSREVNTIIATWNSVEGARDYAYALTDASGNEVASGSTYDNYVSFDDMQTSTYTLTVTAQYASEGYRDSQPASITIDFVREHQEIWRASGTYSSVLLDKSWSADLVAYDDNTYVILSWYGAEGYNFGFSLDENNASDMFRPDPSYSYNQSTGAYSVPTGIAAPAAVSVFAADNQCAFEGNAGRGTITLSVSDGTNSGNDTFRWGVSIRDFVGTWNCDFAAYDSSGDSSYDSFYSGAVEITLGTEENTLMVPLPYYYGNPFGTAKMVVDMSTMTFSIQPASLTSAGYEYILSGTASETAPLTGKLTNNGIIFDAIQIWCMGYDYLTASSYLKYTR
jgi:lipoprotein